MSIKIKIKLNIIVEKHSFRSFFISFCNTDIISLTKNVLSHIILYNDLIVCILIFLYFKNT
jgi:hypothetical protein